MMPKLWELLYVVRVLLVILLNFDFFFLHGLDDGVDLLMELVASFDLRIEGPTDRISDINDVNVAEVKQLLDRLIKVFPR